MSESNFEGNILKNGLRDENIVEKSRPLLLMKPVPFGIGELKVLDTYLSRINARNEECCTVSFSKEEFEDLMGIERMRTERLAKYVDSLMGKTVTVPEGKGWHKYVLFVESRCYQDEKTSQWWIDISCSREAKKLFFNLENVGYIRYQLKNILPLTSKYSIFLYYYLLDNRFRKEWSVDIQELREDILKCTSQYYTTFKFFKYEILERAINEVNKTTDILFSYTVEKKGKKADKIHFILEKDNVSILSEKIVSTYEEADEADDEDNSIFYSDKRLEFLADACNFEFNEQQMRIISDILLQIRDTDSSYKTELLYYGKELAEYNLLMRKYHILNYRATVTEIHNRFTYFQSILESKKN